MNPPQARYVDLDGGSVFRPPFLQKDTFLTAWLVPSDKAAQQRVLDRTFNEPSGGAVDYRALTSHVLFSFANTSLYHFGFGSVLCSANSR